MSDRNLQLVGSIDHPILGFSKELPSNVLPSKGDVLRHIAFLREGDSTPGKPYLKNVKAVLTICVDQIISVWMKASLPQMITKKSISRKVLKLHDEYKKVVKCMKSARSEQIIEEFSKSCDCLFDICTCTCPFTSQQLRGKMLCQCSEPSRILVNEVTFLFDQI